METDSDVENFEAILYVRIKELEKELQLKFAEVEQLQFALQEKEFQRLNFYLDPRVVEEEERSLSCFM